VRVKDALDTIDALIGNLVLALRGASAITLIAAALVLGGALAASQRFRVYDAVVLKTFGATRARLTAAYALEYLLIGLATVLFGSRRGLDRRRTHRHAGDGISLRLDRRPGDRRGACGAFCHHRARACRHVRRARAANPPRC
jgi:hypothetical protein